MKRPRAVSRGRLVEIAYPSPEHIQRGAVAAARRTGGRYLAWPTGDEWWDYFTDPSGVEAVTRVDGQAAREQVVQAAENGWTVAELASALDACFRGRPDMDRDWRMVAAWELDTAHGHGWLRAWLAIARDEGLNDPRVCRRSTGRFESTVCKRIHLQAGEPRWFRLSEVLAGEARGNLGFPSAEWVAVVGPTHPNCRCPRWEFEIDEIAAMANGAADWIERMFPS